MSLRSIANRFTSGINPNVSATLKRSSGYATLDTGKRVPTYTEDQIQFQVQALSKGEIQHLDGLNIQGVARAAYFDGHVWGLVRGRRAGGDLIVFPDGTFPEGNTWLCVHVLEQWPAWGKVALTLQTDTGP